MHSDVYAYDICLSAFTIAVSDLSKMYHTTAHAFWEPRIRPDEDVFLDCINTPHTSQSLTDEILNDICQRWQRTRAFRNLPLDRHGYLREYEKFRHDLASLPKSRGSYGIVKTTNFFHLSALERLPLSMEIYDSSFIARFHKALCISYLAVLSRQLAAASLTTDGILSRIGFLDCELWAPHSTITICGHEVELSLQDKVDRLEVFDLIYHFVLGKLFYPSLLNKWIRACVDSYLFVHYKDPSRPIWSGSRRELMDNFRWHCTPDDVLGLSGPAPHYSYLCKLPRKTVHRFDLCKINLYVCI